MQERLTCEICLDLLYKPYSLSPCGHIACEDCLVKWFSSEVVEPEPDAPRMIRIKKCPSCREEIIERPSMVWKIKDAVEIFVKSGLAENLPPPPEEPQTRGRDPWREIFPPVIRRNNRLPPPFPVLPHIGEMLPNGHRMPVIPIPFPQAQAMLDAQMMGNLDAEDGGIYRCVECHYEIVDGVCAGCGQLYDDNPNLDYEGEGYDDVGDYSDVEEGEPRQEDDHEHAWLHNGYSWPLDAGDAGEERAGDGLWPAEEPPRRYRRRIVGEGEDADDGEDFDDEYESSFIDDGDEAGYRSPSRDLYSRSPSRDLYSRSPSRDLYSHSPTRVAPPRRRSNVQVPWPSSRERSGAPAPEDRLLWSWTSGSGSSQSQTAASSAEEPVAGPSSSSPSPARVRRRTALVIESDDDEEEEEEDHEESLAEQVAAREREIYGDDGSVAHRFEDVIGNIDDGEEYALEADDDEGEYNPEEDDEEGYSDREELDWGAVDATVDFSDEEAAGFSYGDEDYDVPGEYYDY
ncbi:hypothetical protein OE88DRAFT_1341356 [Heliocybe sulcata]|uniref:RING-type domain-containing protein n=1 Tax=Heliocybe sulcata TaxID=5364 RepID=A0A5C3N9I0_9AGAM|nr:hypothetical protein OE88DRAFT_1341356 [Heliocybe sulcata]